MNIIIKPLYHVDELTEMQRLEQQVWGDDYTPVHQTITVAKNGGIILGAYDDDRLIGFLYSFPGYDGTSVYLCSHLAAIHADYRGKGIGELLKQKQKELAIEKGFRLITWTYDPLESANANLNIRKLNGICQTYIEDCYGKLEGKLNAGLETDRFLVEWHLTSQHVNNKLELDFNDAFAITAIDYDQNNDPYIKEVHDHVVNKLDYLKMISLAVPTQFQAMKERNFPLAKSWRMQTRELFQLLFSHEYVVVNVMREKDSNIQHYILVKKHEVHI